MPYTCTFLILYNASGFARLRYGSIDRRSADRFRQTSYAKGISRGFAQAQSRYDPDRRCSCYDEPRTLLILFQRFADSPSFYVSFSDRRCVCKPVDT